MSLIKDVKDVIDVIKKPSIITRVKSTIKDVPIIKDVDTSNYQAKGYSDILLMPLFEEDKKADYILRSKKSMGFSLQESISNKINAAIEDRMLEKAGIQQSILDSIHQSAQIAELKAYEDEGKKREER